MPIFAAAAGTPFYLDASFWVAVCLFAFFAFLGWKGVHKAIGTSLDERADKIKSELDEAKRLREEAQALLASYHRKQKEAEDQADAIVQKARKDAESMAEQARKDLQDRLERRAALAEAKIANAEAQALGEVKAKAAQMAIDASQKLLANQMTASNHNSLVKKGIDSLSSNLS